MSQESPAAASAASASDPSRLGIYEWTSVIGALVYLSLPVFVAAPGVLETVTGITLTPTHLANMRSLLTLVTPIALLYGYGLWTRTLTVLDMSLAWRLAWVGPWLVVNWARGALETGPFLLVGSVDLGLPLAALALDPRARGALGRLRAHFRRPVPSIGHRLLGIEGWIGFLAVAVTSVSLLSRPDHGYVESFAVSVPGCYYLFMVWAARAETRALRAFVLLFHAVMIGAMLACNAYGFEGETRTNFAAYAGLGLYIQAYAWLWQDRIHGPARWSYARWVVIGAIGVAAVSSVWSLGGPYYGTTCSQLAINIHRQDLVIGGFAVLVGLLLVDIAQRAPWQASVIAWLLPFAALWFTSATKLLCHFNVGTPFHPSWTARGLAPAWGGSHVMDVEFWMATMLMTAVSTTFTAVVVLLNLDTRGWRRLSWHGTLMILLSAVWMVATSSGMPAPMQELAAAGSVPRFLPGDPVAAVAVHLRDLIMGIFLIAAGPLLHRLTPDTARASRYAVAVCWVLSVVPKVFVHLHLAMA